MKRLLALLLTFALLAVWGCAAAPEPDHQSSKPPVSSDTPLDADQPEDSDVPSPSGEVDTSFAPAGGRQLTEAELDAFRTLLDHRSAEEGTRNWYNEVLHCLFDAPESVDWSEFFYDGFASGWLDPPLSEDEKAFCEQNGVPLELSVFRLPVQDMNAIAQQYFGITLEESNGIGLDKPYYEETDSYYIAHGDTHVTGSFELHMGVEQEDGTIYLYYDSNVLVLRPNADGTGYLFLSNLPCES